MSSQFKMFMDDNLNQIELVEYDYSQNNYRVILNEAFKKDLRQIIITTTVFKEFIQNLYVNNCFLLDIKFIDSIEEYDFSNIQELIHEVNVLNGNKFLLNSLIKEIDWLVNDESIDIKSITFLDKDANRKFEIYNNGVILGDNNQTLIKINNMIAPYLLRNF